MIAVADADVAESAAADGAGHGREADEADDDEGEGADELGEGFGDEDFGDDLEFGGAHGLCGFDEAVGELSEGVFGHAAVEHDSGDAEGDGCCGGADGASGD